MIGIPRSTCRVALLWLLLLAFSHFPIRPAEAPSRTIDQRFAAALKAFQDGWHQRADREFGEFIVDFPISERVPEAVLLQARARFHLRQYDRVISLLRSKLPLAGRWIEPYRLLIADALTEQGEFNASALEYERFLQDFPQSAFRLNAAYGQAYAKFKAGDFTRTITLLKDPSTNFQKAIPGNTNLTLVAQGYLLLAEAFNTQREYRAAEEALQQLGNSNPGAEFEWKRQYLLARTELLDRRPADALARTAKLFDVASAAGEPLLQVQSLRLMGEIQEATQPQSAFQTYDKITELRGAPLDEKRKAVLKLVELSVGLNQTTNAIQRLRAFMALNPEDSARDLLALTLGELHLKEFYSLAAPTNAAAAPDSVLTNLLATARTNFDLVILTFTNSSFVGKAWLDRGWCAWEENARWANAAQLAQAKAAFQTATERLPRSEGQAVARFKLADCQFELGDVPGAIQNYQLLLDQYAQFPFLGKERIFEQALYQVMRGQIQLRQLTPAKATAERLLTNFPGGDLADNCLLVLSEAFTSERQPAAGRELLNRLVRTFPKSPLLPQAERALARSYVQENNWPAAILQYDSWVGRYTNDPALPQVQFDRAWANYRAGQDTNAFRLFTNFVARYPASSLVPLAHYWVGDFFFRKANYPKAEEAYQRLFPLATNSSTSLLSYQARLMSAQAALRRESYTDARGYLTSLIDELEESAKNGGSPVASSIIPEGYFWLGETYLSEPVADSKNSLTNFSLAYRTFDRMARLYPTNRLAALALGRMGDCAFQLASQNPRLLNDAVTHYRAVLSAPQADVSTRSQAEVGLGRVLEKLAMLMPATQQEAALGAALENYLNVIYGNRLRPEAGEKPDPFWVKEAGLDACRLAQTLHRDAEAVKVYQRLVSIVPSMRVTWEKKLAPLLKPAELGRN